jgi:aminoglycoside phosphotransferase (APT) family kinase protein
MPLGAPKESRWLRAEARRDLPPAIQRRILQAAFPNSRLLKIRPLTEGLRNSNFLLHLDNPTTTAVLRIYEHDSSLCQKELDLFEHLASSIPVPEILYAEPQPEDGLQPFALLRYVDAISLKELKRSGDSQALAQAAASAGETLAAIGRITFDRPGWLAPGLTVTPIFRNADHALPFFVDSCLQNNHLQRRMSGVLRANVHDLLWSADASLSHITTESRLVHGDYGKRNLLVAQTAGHWRVTAVLDWELAVSATPLIDLGHFLRYERPCAPRLEPHFSTGFERAGGHLPPNLRHLSRILDLAALVESLTHPALPADVAAELLELIRATTENRDHRLP